MKKNIWIFNHYATNMFKNEAGRHYWFAENLIKQDYKATIFCASTVHNSADYVDTGDKKYISDAVNGIPFVFVKAPFYVGNGKQRIKNIIVFYKNLFSVAEEYAKLNGKPDVIFASSVHPLTLVAGIKIAKKFGLPCICEVRDLWPESLIAYGALTKRSIISKILYKGERWIYKKADKLIFTMEGGIDYIKEKGWDNEISISKVYHINNGVDLEAFNYNREQYTLNDADLEDEVTFKAVYTGSIRRANNLQTLVEVARIIQNKGYNNVKIIVYGDGDYREYLEQYSKDNGINNIIFKGRIDKKYIPFILSKCDISILNLYQGNLFRFGMSPNKLFDYFASGKPILSVECSFDLIKKYQCGITMSVLSADEIAKEITLFCDKDDDQIKLMSENALKAARDYDFKVLTDKLIELF